MDMSVPPDVLYSCRRAIVVVLQALFGAGLLLLITGALLVGVAYVVTTYTFTH